MNLYFMFNYKTQKLSFPIIFISSIIILLFVNASCINDYKDINADRSLDELEEDLNFKSTNGNDISNPEQSGEISGIKRNGDKDLKRRAEEYFEAIHNEDFDTQKVVSYMYPGIFTYNQRNSRVYFETDVVKLIKEPVQKFKRMVDQANASYQTDVVEIGKRINLGDKKLYFLKFSMTIKKGMDSYTINDYILGISLGTEQEWTFLEVNETAKEVLKSKFSFRDIDIVMNEYERLELNK